MNMTFPSHSILQKASFKQCHTCTRLHKGTDHHWLCICNFQRGMRRRELPHLSSPLRRKSSPSLISVLWRGNCSLLWGMIISDNSVGTKKHKTLQRTWATTALRTTFAALEFACTFLKRGGGGSVKERKFDTMIQPIQIKRDPYQAPRRTYLQGIQKIFRHHSALTHGTTLA